MVRLVQFDGDVPLPVPADHPLALLHCFPKLARPPPVQFVIPAQGDGAPRVAYAAVQYLGEPDDVRRAAVTAHQRIIAALGRRLQAREFPGAFDRHAARAVHLRVAPVGLEEILLRVLVDAERDDVQHARLGDPLNALLGFLEGRQAEVMPKQGIRLLLPDPVNEVLRVDFRAPLPAEGARAKERDAIVEILRAVEHDVEKPSFFTSSATGRVPAKTQTGRRASRPLFSISSRTRGTTLAGVSRYPRDTMEGRCSATLPTTASMPFAGPRNIVS